MLDATDEVRVRSKGQHTAHCRELSVPTVLISNDFLIFIILYFYQSRDLESFKKFYKKKVEGIEEREEGTSIRLEIAFRK